MKALYEKAYGTVISNLNLIMMKFCRNANVNTHRVFDFTSIIKMATTTSFHTEMCVMETAQGR